MEGRLPVNRSHLLGRLQYQRLPLQVMDGLDPSRKPKVYRILSVMLTWQFTLCPLTKRRTENRFVIRKC
jgi:hypothetical protein